MLVRHAPALKKRVGTALVADIKLVAYKLLPLGWVAYNASRHNHSERLFGASLLIFFFSRLYGLSCLFPPVPKQQTTKGIVLFGARR